MNQGWGMPQPPQPGYGPPPQAYGPDCGIEVTTHFLILQWILYFVTPRIQINGYVQERAWGRHLFPAPPGYYHLRVWFPYMFRDQCGPAEVQVPVQPGAITMVYYDAPFFMFSNGTLRVTGMRPAAPMQLGR